MARKLSASVNCDGAGAPAPGPSFVVANLNPRKRPRSIRRHKPAAVLHASKNGMSSIHTSNHISSSSLDLNASLIYAPSHSIMINNPRNDADFIADSNIECNHKFLVKAEPVSPIDMGAQVKVPDHTDDDPLFESLFDFRDLQDDDLFLHQVPIYNPPHNPDNSPTIDCNPCVDNDEIKPPTIMIPHPESKDLNGLSKSSCAATHPSDLSPAELGTSSSSNTEHVDDNGALSIGKHEEPDRFIDSGDGLICDLDQLDFDSMLHGDDEDGDEESNMCAFHVDVNSHGNIDASNSHTARDDSGSYAEDHDSCGHHGSRMDDDDIDGNCDAVEHAGYGETFDFDTTGSESPRTWLCKVKVESTQELDGFMQVNDDGLLREELNDHTHSGFKLGLKLNFEDVLHAWSDRGSFWMDGDPPLQVENCLDFLGGWLVPDMSSSTTIEGDGQQLVPVLNQKSKKGDGSAREASVLRYREKRRTRHFCKKIRYEVRKLNAEKRPRMKGRFVKRISIVV